MEFNNIKQYFLKHKIPLNGDVFYYTTLLAIAIITFFPLFGSGIGSADDMTNYVNTLLGKEIIASVWYAEMSGRFYYLIVGLFHHLPYEIDDLFVIKLYQILPIFLNLVLFGKVVYILTKSKEVSSLFVILFLVVAQFSHHTSLFFTYPFYFTFSFSLILAAYLLLYRFQVSKKKKNLIFSALLFGIGLLFYEVFILFISFAVASPAIIPLAALRGRPPCGSA